MLWVIFAALTGAAVFAVLWPLSRKPAALDAGELDVAFYKAQTAEIERDKTRGVISDAEAEVARNEAARRLMAIGARGDEAPMRASPWPTRAVALGAMLFIPSMTLGLYYAVGQPNMPDEPLEARLKAAPGKMDMATAISRIEQHLVTDPNDARGWSVIAPIYMRLGRSDDAERAYVNILRLNGASGEGYAGLGEAQVASASGMVTADAKASFEHAIAIDPKSPRAAFYLGLAAEQDGDKPKAVALWRQLVADSPPDAPWVPLVKNHLASATGATPPEAASAGTMAAAAPAGGVPAGPMAAAVAAMPNDQQQAMIHRMVDGLADRLKSNGSDIDGWLRLVRAYRVLDEQDKAKVALGDARRNFAADPDAKKRLDALAHELGLES